MGKGIVKLGEGNWAVKDGNLLAAKETNGRFKNAEFTVARGTDATYVGKDGLIKRFSSGLANEVANGDFELGDNGDWTLPSGWSISNNQLVGNDPTGFATVNNVFYANKSYRLDIDVAEVDSGDFTIIPNSTDSNSNGTTAIGSTGLHTFYFHIGTIDLETLYVTFSGDFVGKINSITVRDIEDFDDRPRIDFTDNTDGHLLLEPQSTNLIPYSEDFEGGSWTNESIGTTPTLDGGYAAPDGSNSAYKISNANQDSFWYYPSVADSDDSRTIWARTVSGTGTAQLTSHNSNTNNTFNLTETWQRFEVNGTTSGTGSTSFYAVDFRGSGTLTELLIWGAQLEALSYPTSYIPTNGSTVTRDAETCTGAGEAADFNSEEGVLYAEIARSTVHNDYELLSISPTNNSDGTHYASLGYNNTDNKLWIRAKIGNTVAIASIGEVDTILNQFYKIAIKYKSGENAIYVDGEKLINTDITDGSEATTFTPTQNTISDLEFRHWDANNSFHGKVKAIRVYKEALSHSELVTLTS